MSESNLQPIIDTAMNLLLHCLFTISNTVKKNTKALQINQGSPPHVLPRTKTNSIDIHYEIYTCLKLS